MSRALSVSYEMNFKIEFQTAIRGHHVYKDAWAPHIGQKLICKTDTREEAIEYDKNAIGVFKSTDEVTLLVGHLPIEISCLLTNFLNAAPENKLTAFVVGKRKREVGLVIPAKYVALTRSKIFGNILFDKLHEKKEKHPNFELDVITTSVINTSTCEINTI